MPPSAPLRAVVGAILPVLYVRPCYACLASNHFDGRTGPTSHPVTRELLECGHAGELREWVGTWPHGVHRRRCRHCAPQEPRARVRCFVGDLEAEGVPADVARELAQQLEGVDAMRAAFRRVFGADPSEGGDP